MGAEGSRSLCSKSVAIDILLFWWGLQEGGGRRWRRFQKRRWGRSDEVGLVLVERVDVRLNVGVLIMEVGHVEQGRIKKVHGATVGGKVGKVVAGESPLRQNPGSRIRGEYIGQQQQKQQGPFPIEGVLVGSCWWCIEGAWEGVRI